jgi:O-antigen ligase
VFGDIGTRVTALFDNPNMLSIYLIIVFPFALYAIASAKKSTHRIFYILCAGLIALCTLYTWSRGAWLGIIVATCIFLVVYNIKNIWIIVSALSSLPLWSALLPAAVINRALSIGALTDSSSYYRIYTWRGVWNMIKDYFFGGIGVGESAFSEVYPIYSYSGTETVMHSHNLFMEITLQIGVVGLLIFLLIMILFAQKCFNTVRRRAGNDPQPRTVAAAGLASICGALIMGLTDYIWYNYRVFLLFWAVIALTCAIIRIDDSVKEKERLRIISNNQRFDLDIDSE